MINCALCKSKRIKLFHRISNYSYYECFDCSTLFLHPKPEIKKIENYYQKDFNYSAGLANEKLIRKRSRIILKNLKRLNKTGKSLLDIGSGYGYFVDEAKKLNLKIKAIEPSKNLANRSIYNDINSLYKSTFDDYYEKFKENKFDFITLIHTIEHVRDPLKTIKQATELLKPGGILFLETPNLNSHLFNAEKTAYTFLTPPDHIWIFSFRSFKFMLNSLRKNKIVKFSTYSQSEHLMGIIKRKLTFIKSGTNFLIKDKKIEKNLNSEVAKNNNPKFSIRDYKYLVFDKLLASTFTPLLNIGGYGSILELYIRK